MAIPVQVINDGPSPAKESAPGKKKKTSAPFLLFAPGTSQAPASNKQPVGNARRGTANQQNELAGQKNRVKHTSSGNQPEKAIHRGTSVHDGLRSNVRLKQLNRGNMPLATQPEGKQHLQGLRPAPTKTQKGTLARRKVAPDNLIPRNSNLAKPGQKVTKETAVHMPANKPGSTQEAPLVNKQEGKQVKPLAPSLPRVVNLEGPLTFHPIEHIRQQAPAFKNRLTTPEKSPANPLILKAHEKEAIVTIRAKHKRPGKVNLQRTDNKQHRVRVKGTVPQEKQRTDSPPGVIKKNSITRSLVNPSARHTLQLVEMEHRQTRPIPLPQNTEGFPSTSSLHRFNPFLLQPQNGKENATKASKNGKKGRTRHRQDLQRKQDSQKPGVEDTTASSTERIDAGQEFRVKEGQANMESFGRTLSSEQFVAREQEGQAPLAQLHTHQSSGSTPVSGSRTSRANSRPLAWLKAMMQRIEAAEQAPGSWHTLEMNLDQGDGSLTIELKRHSSKVSVLVNFSDAVLKTMAEEHSAKIQQTLQNHFSHPVDLSFTSSHSDSTAASRDRQENVRQRTEAALEKRGLSEPQSDSPSRRRSTEAANEWVG